MVQITLTDKPGSEAAKGLPEKLKTGLAREKFLPLGSRHGLDGEGRFVHHLAFNTGGFSSKGASREGLTYITISYKPTEESIMVDIKGKEVADGSLFLKTAGEIVKEHLNGSAKSK